MKISEMKAFELFDEIPYKYVKHFTDDDDMGVEITDLPFVGGWCIKYDILGQYMEETYNVEIEYNSYSPIALRLKEMNESVDEDEIDAFLELFGTTIF
jgi:hypothetical protein